MTTFETCISINQALYFDLFNDIPFRYIKQFFENDYDKDDSILDINVEFSSKTIGFHKRIFAVFAFELSCEESMSGGSLTKTKHKTFNIEINFVEGSGMCMTLCSMIPERDNSDEENDDDEEEESDEFHTVTITTKEQETNDINYLYESMKNELISQL